MHTVSALCGSTWLVCGAARHTSHAKVGTLISDQPVSVQKCTQIRLITNYIGFPRVHMIDTLLSLEPN